MIENVLYPIVFVTIVQSELWSLHLFIVLKLSFFYMAGVLVRQLIDRMWK